MSDLPVPPDTGAARNWIFRYDAERDDGTVGNTVVDLAASPDGTPSLGVVAKVAGEMAVALGSRLDGLTDPVVLNAARQIVTAAGVPELERALSAARQERDEAREDAEEAGRLETDLWEVAHALGLETIPGKPRLPELVTALRDREGRLEDLLVRASQELQEIPPPREWATEYASYVGTLDAIEGALSPSKTDLGGER
jgi:hypothetical protein